MIVSLTKANSALRNIREVADELSLEPHVLRFWEKEFPQLKPMKRRGRRYYRPEDMVMIRQIQSLLHEKGYTIKGARAILDNPRTSETSFEDAKNPLHSELKQLHQQLLHLREKISTALVSSRG